MITADEIIEQHLGDFIAINHLTREDIDEIRIALIVYGKAVVDVCAGSFECTMETADYDDENSYQLANGKCVNPVLVRQSVLDVKNQIR
jgi:hypothetical protein